MTADGVELVRRTFALVEPNVPQATALFCRRLTHLAPDVRAMIPSDLAQHADDVAEVISAIVRSLDDDGEVARLAERLAHRHAVTALRPHHYDAIGDAMLCTLATGLGHLFTPGHRDAWRAAYDAVVAALLHVTRQSA